MFEHLQATMMSRIQSPNSALGDCSPRSLMDSELGPVEVPNTLGQIEHIFFTEG
jgi:hypothetical protein